MKICPKCHEEVEDNFDLCWNCNYSFPDKAVIQPSEFDNEPINKHKLKCLRCQVPMQYSGEYKFLEGSRIGALGNLFELFQNRECFDLYTCPKCGKVEFFVTNA